MSSELYLQPGDLIEYKEEFKGNPNRDPMVVRSLILRFEVFKRQFGDYKTTVIYLRGRKEHELTGVSVEKYEDSYAQVTEMEQNGPHLEPEVSAHDIKYFIDHVDWELVKRGPPIHNLNMWSIKGDAF